MFGTRPKPSIEKTSESALGKYQSQFYRLLDQEGNDGIVKFLKVLDEKPTLGDRMICIHEKLTHFNLLQEKFEQDYKNDQTATKYQKEGQAFFCTGRYNEALKSYTKSLMSAKVQDLCMAYAYRSAALYMLGLYKECLIDIDRAIASNYPENLKPKLLDRKATAIKMLKNSKGSMKFYEEVPTIPTKQRNLKIPCATNSIEIQKCRTGEKVVATKSIKVGDVIAVEEPLTSIMADAYLYHCHDCLHLCYNPIPCNICTEVIYCSEACKNKAFMSYHNFECFILLSLRKAVGRNATLVMAVRMFFQYKEKLSIPILNLIQKVQNEKFDEQIQLEITAAVMYDLIKKYTDKFDGPNGEAIESSFKNNIVGLLQVCTYQASGIQELRPFDEQDQKVYGHDKIASAIYPFFALCRHSCAPNAYPHHHGKKRVLRAIRTIAVGQEVLVSFGQHYFQNSREERQDILFKQYHFKCTCRACRESWDKVEKLKESIPTVEDTRFLNQMDKMPDVSLAKKILPQKIKKMQLLERSEPGINVIFQQKLLFHCYDVLGNKRMIL